MKRLSVLLLLIALTGCRLFHNSSQPKTIGGTLATGPEYGFSVGIVSTKGHEVFCSGALVSPTVIVTAAHCVKALNTYLQVAEKAPSEILVHFGPGADTTIDQGLVAVSQITVSPLHKAYPDRIADADVAYLTLSTPAPEGFRPITPLLDWDTLAQHLRKKAAVRAVGFGCTNTSISCAKGKKTKVEMTINEVGPLLVDAGDPRQTATHGDSGGALVVDTPQGMQLIGVVSGVGRVQGAYTLVYPHACWLTESVRLDWPGAKAHCTSDFKRYTPEAIKGASFATLCKQPQSPFQKRTIDVLLRHAGTTDCAEAEQRLAAMDDVSLDGEFLHELLPLIGLKQMKRLSLHDNAIVDFLPLAFLPSLKTLEFDFAQADSAQMAELHKLRPDLKFVSADVDQLMIKAIDENNLPLFDVLAAGVGSWETSVNQGETYFLRAVWKGRQEMADGMLKFGADINAQNSETHNSALAYVAISDSIELTQWLLGRGANACLKNKFGETALDVARRVGSTKVLPILAAIPCR